jgi:hypothetical protein
VKTCEEFYHAGRQVGWAVYLDGHLHYLNEQILDNDRPVASRKFEAVDVGWHSNAARRSVARSINAQGN